LLRKELVFLFLMVLIWMCGVLLGFLLMPNFKPRPNVNLTDLPGFCVADLIIPCARVWNILLLQDLFDPFTVKCILSIHLPFSRNLISGFGLRLLQVFSPLNLPLLLLVLHWVESLRFLLKFGISFGI
jgi:hypothetical protein